MSWLLTNVSSLVFKSPGDLWTTQIGATPNLRDFVFASKQLAIS